tara:strand:+ start:23671 stop:24474 length:804 start_codon:yes stop_codon:yes gene_type:complete
MELTRHQGLGNVFLIALLEELPENPSGIARKYCDPINGIGADGLIIGTPLSENPNSVSRFHLFNKDGGRAELSGNGLRCFAQALFMGSKISKLDFNVETDVGSRYMKIEETATIETEFTVAAEVGEAVLVESLKSDRFEESQILRAAKVDIGNPHLVVEVENFDDFALERFAVSENEKTAPIGINVHLIKVDDSSNIRMRHWERGVGVTEACGTGACAGAFVASKWGQTESIVNVHMPGGSGIVSIGQSITLSGPAVFMDKHTVNNG